MADLPTGPSDIYGRSTSSALPTSAYQTGASGLSASTRSPALRIEFTGPSKKDISATRAYLDR